MSVCSCQGVVSLFIGVVITLSLEAKASEVGVLAAVGSQLNFEYGSNGRTLETRQPWSIRGGYRFDFADTYVEFSSFDVSNGAPMLQVQRTHREFIVWVRRTLIPSWDLKPFLAGGIGWQYDIIETNFNSEESRDPGNSYLVGAVAAGLLADLTTNLDLTLESRLAVSSNYSPNPILGLALYLGFRF